MAYPWYVILDFLSPPNYPIRLKVNPFQSDGHMVDRVYLRHQTLSVINYQGLLSISSQIQISIDY